MQTKDLVKYQSLKTMWKVVRAGKPEHLARRITLTEDNLLETKNARLQTVARSFRWRTVESWNSLPQLLIQVMKLCTFKRQLKTLISEENYNSQNGN